MDINEAKEIVFDFLTEDNIFLGSIKNPEAIIVIGDEDNGVYLHAAHLAILRKTPLILFSTFLNTDLETLCKHDSYVNYFGNIVNGLEGVGLKFFGDGPSSLPDKFKLLMGSLSDSLGRKPKSVTLCCFTPYLKRYIATFRKFAPDVEFSVSSPDLNFRKFPEEIGIQIMVDEVNRLIESVRQRIIDPINISDEVREALEMLRAHSLLVAH